MTNLSRPSEAKATSSSLRVPPWARTVRFRLTVWYSSLLLVFGIAFVVVLNVAARLDQPQELRVGDLRVKDIEWEAVRTGPGQAVGVRPVSITLAEARDNINEQNLDNLRTWSLIAVVGLALSSGIGGYVLSGMMLRPVRDITQIASEISVTNLSQRINHQGPDDELKALANTFDSMIERLERSFVQQRRFVEDASHELRNPLAAIRMNIEVAEMDPDIAADDYRALIETVKQQTDRMTRLSEDLLLLSTSDGVAPELEPVELRALAHDAANELADAAARRDVTIAVETPEGPVEGLAEPDRLYRCVLNLIENAVKYAGPGSHVVAKVTHENGLATLSVADNGAGIPAEALPRIFDRFYRVDRGRGRREGGTGLGLAIVKELLQNMGGTVDVASSEGRGTTFTIRLQGTRSSSLLLA